MKQKIDDLKKIFRAFQKSKKEHIAYLKKMKVNQSIIDDLSKYLNSMEEIGKDLLNYTAKGIIEKKKVKTNAIDRKR